MVFVTQNITFNKFFWQLKRQHFSEVSTLISVVSEIEWKKGYDY